MDGILEILYYALNNEDKSNPFEIHKTDCFEKYINKLTDMGETWREINEIFLTAYNLADEAQKTGFKIGFKPVNRIIAQLIGAAPLYCGNRDA